jgi:hypothetical protein
LLALARLFVAALLFVYGGLLAFTDLFLQAWNVASAGQSDIQARGPILWALYLPTALAGAALAFAAFSYLLLQPGSRSIIRSVVASASAAAMLIAALSLSRAGIIPPHHYPWLAVSGAVMIVVGLWLSIRYQRSAA